MARPPTRGRAGPDDERWLEMGRQARYWPELAPLVQPGRLHSEQFITYSLRRAPCDPAYQIFYQRPDGVLKVIMTP